MTLPSDTKPGDVFRDENGHIWRVLGVCYEPTATLECLTEVPLERRYGGMRGLMWDGFTRLTPETDNGR